MEPHRTHKRIADAIGLVAVFLALFLLALAINTFKASKFIGGDVFPQATISVTGSGEKIGIPDVGRVSFTVREVADDVSDALSNAAEKMNGVLAALDESGVDDDDVRTTSFTINPKYEYQQETVVCVTFPCNQPPRERVLVGQEVAQSVTITIRDTAEAGTILGILGEAEVHNVGSLRFEIDDPESLQDDARRLAIADAEEKAETLAEELDVDLVRVIGFDEYGYSPGPLYQRSASFDLAEADAAFVPEVPIGESTISAQVTVTYEIR